MVKNYDFKDLLGFEKKMAIKLNDKKCISVNSRRTTLRWLEEVNVRRHE